MKSSSNWLVQIISLFTYFIAKCTFWGEGYALALVVIVSVPERICLLKDPEIIGLDCCAILKQFPKSVSSVSVFVLSLELQSINRSLICYITGFSNS